MNPLRGAQAGAPPEALLVDGRTVAEYAWRGDVPLALAPRPYLHPIRTLRGTAVTEAMPTSHRHHLGVSVAIPDLAGHNFWGGRTYLRDRGPTWLDNHGTQHLTQWHTRTSDTLVHDLTWLTLNGTALLRERRTIQVRPIDDRCWLLDFGFSLTADPDAGNDAGPLAARSPALDGRTGAGYGGFFWRAPSATHDARVLGPAGAGVDDVHGVPAPWVAMTGVSGSEDGDRGWTLVFVAGDVATAADPWFVRTRDYPGVGSSLAWRQPLTFQAETPVIRRVLTVVADDVLPRDQVAELAAAAGIRP